MSKRFTVYYFPFAGGSSYSYKEFMQDEENGLLLKRLDYPGHGLRIAEPLHKDIQTIADDAFNTICNDAPDNYVIYGHSMGAVVGFLVARRLARNKRPLPVHLFFTGCGAPSTLSERKKRYHLPEDEFIEELVKLGGLPKEILEDKDIMAFFEPILRADFEALEEYVYEKDAPLDIPITVITGTGETIPDENAMAWQAESTYPLTYKRMEGDHFFISRHAPDIQQEITAFSYSASSRSEIAGKD